MTETKYRIVNHVQRCAPWFKWRQWKIGASMAPTIMGENPYETEMQLYQRIIEGIPVEMNENIQRGIDNEEKALILFNQYVLSHSKYTNIFGKNFSPCCFESLERPWMIASADGWDANFNIGLEIKCPRKFSSELAKNTDGDFVISPPKKYRAQVQHCMAVTGANFWYYIEYVNGDIQGGRVDRDDEYIKTLIKKEQEFHLRLMEFNPPIHKYEEEWSKLI